MMCRIIDNISGASPSCMLLTAGLEVKKYAVMEPPFLLSSHSLPLLCLHPLECWSTAPHAVVLTLMREHYYCVQGAPKKSNPLGKFRYLWNCSKFLHQIYSVYRGALRPHILQISLQYFVAFKSYNYLNLNVHFSK